MYLGLEDDDEYYDEPYLTAEEKRKLQGSFKIRTTVDIDEDKNFFKLKVNVYYSSSEWESSPILNKTFTYPFPRNMESFETWKEEKETESLSKYREFIKYQNICDNSPEKSEEVTDQEAEYIKPHRWYNSRFY